MQQKSHGVGASSAILKAAVASVLLASGAAQAQVLPFEIEGPIDDITFTSLTTPGVAGSITVMGVTVQINDLTTINTPTTGLSASQLNDSMALPGRAQAGFLGGTAIIIGEFDPAIVDATTQLPIVTAQDVFVDPAENVVVGAVTANSTTAAACEDPNTNPSGLPADGAIEINGVPLNFLTDARIPFGTAVDANAFPINPCSAQVGGGAAVEGYYAGGALNIFHLEAVGDVIGGNDATSIERASCRNSNNQIEVRGFTTGDFGTVTVYAGPYSELGVPVGTATIVADGLGGGSYRLRTNIASACPSQVTAINDNDQSFSTADVTIR